MATRIASGPPDAVPTDALDRNAVLLDSVTVVGQRHDSRHELKNVIIPAFVKDHGAPTCIDQYARCVEAVCPRTTALSHAENARVSERIIEIATQLSAPVKMPCDHNIKVAPTAYPQKVLDEVIASDTWLLGRHYVDQTEDLATIKFPIQAWYANATRGGAGPPRRDSAYGRSVAGVPGRRSEGLSSDFGRILVVANLNKVGGPRFGIGRLATT